MIFLWTFKGDHATTFAIANTAANCQADVNSQQEVARMLGVSQGCISKILRRNRDTGRPHQIRWKSPRHGKTVNCSEWSERTASSWLLVCECRRSSYLGGGCQFEPFGDGFWPPDFGLGVQPHVLGSLRSSEWGRKYRVWDLRQWRHCIFSDESRFSLYHSDSRVRVRRRQGERLIDACVQPNDGNRGPSVMVRGAIHHGGGVSWSWWMEPWTGIGTSRYWGIKYCHGTRVFRRALPLCTSKTMPVPVQHVTR